MMDDDEDKPIRRMNGGRTVRAIVSERFDLTLLSDRYRVRTGRSLYFIAFSSLARVVVVVCTSIQPHVFS